MTLDDLKELLRNDAVPIGTCQALLLKTLVASGGRATIRQLAIAFAITDENQLLYRENRLRETAIEALKDRGIISEAARTVMLNIEALTGRQRAEIARICEEKLRAPVSPCTDGRIIGKGFDEGCPFCQYNLTGEKPVENDYAFAKPDIEPFREGHTLIIPKRHVADCFDMSKRELDAVYDVLATRRKQLLEADPAIMGFNVGFNSGAVAGQTVFHCHIHLIPRRPGDGEHPGGGARRAIEARVRSSGC